VLRNFNSGRKGKQLRKIIREVDEKFLFGSVTKVYSKIVGNQGTLKNLTIKWLNIAAEPFKKRWHRYRNLSAIKSFSYDFKLIEFKLFDSEDPFDTCWEEWSRIYEYEYVLETLTKLGANSSSELHNTCWGFHGVHVKFKETLEKDYPLTLNSDVRQSDLPKTVIYDLTKKPLEKYKNKFDFVLNVSTLEEIDFPHIETFKNLLDMVKRNGYLIVTFDIPGIQLEMFEKLFGSRISSTRIPLTGLTSKLPSSLFPNMSSGYFVVQRV